MKSPTLLLTVLTILLLNAFPAGVAAQQKIIIPLSGYDLLYHPGNDRLYITTGLQGAQTRDTVALINPANGQVVSTIFVGTGAGKMAISDDRHYLYVGVAGPKVVRIDLTTGQKDQEFSVDFNSNGCPTVVIGMRVMPGRPETVVVSAACFEISPSHVGIAVFDNGVQRLRVVPPRVTGARRIAFGSTPDTLWGYNTDTDGFELYRFKINAEGISIAENVGQGLTYAFGQEVEFANGLLYTGNGRAIDVENKIIHGRFYTTETIFTHGIGLDPVAGRAYFALRTGSDLIIQEFETATYRLLSEYQTALSGVEWTPRKVVKCGQWGLALGGPDNSNIVIFPLSVLQPIIYTPPAPAPINHQVRRLRVPNNYIVYSPRHRLIYASTPSQVGNFGNSVVPIDPLTGTVGEPVYAGSDPWQMTLSENEEYLYVALYNGWSVRRFHLPELTPQQRFPTLDVSHYSPPRVNPLPTRTADLLPVPGHPESVMISTAASPGASSGAAFFAVSVYDNGIQRPAQATRKFALDPPMAITSLQPGSDGQTFYGAGYDFAYNGYDTPFYKLKLAADGVYIDSADTGLKVSARALRCDSGLCFTETGLVIDPEARVIKGRCQIPIQPRLLGDGYTGAVVPDVPRNRIWYVASDQAKTIVSGFDLQTFQPTGSLLINGLAGDITNSFLLSEDQLGFSTPGEIVMVPLSLVESPLPPRDRTRAPRSRSVTRRTAPGSRRVQP